MSTDDPIAEVLAKARALPDAAIERVFARYGRPLDDESPVLDPVVTLERGSLLGRLRYRAPVDVIANDHFVLLRAGEPPCAMPGPLFAAVVAALGRTP